MKKIATLLCLFLFYSTYIFSQAGNLDNTFDSDGKTLTAIGTHNSLGRGVAIQPDGKIVVVGYTTNTDFTLDIAVVRYNEDGSLDNTFDGDGIVTSDPSTGSDDYGKGVAIDADGKIVVVGYSLLNFSFDVTVLRYNTDGSLDASFSSDGFVTTSIGSFDDVGNAIAIQSDGKILVAGSTSNGSASDFLLVRYDDDGSLDDNFGTNGITTTDFTGTDDQGYSIALQSDGKILVGGLTAINGTNNFALARYSSAGVLDNSYSSDGLVTTSVQGVDDEAYGIALQSDGKAILAGKAGTNSGAYFGFARYTTTGSLDNTFSSDGKYTVSFGNSPGYANGIVVQPDGKIVAAGLSGDNPNQKFTVVRISETGALDNSFSSDGKQTTDIGNGEDVGTAVTLQPDGKIVVVGFSTNNNTFNFSVARYISGLSLGVIDFESEKNSVLIYPNPVQSEAQLEYTLVNSETLSLYLMDASGRIAQSFFNEENRTSGTHREVLHLDPSLPAGNYMLILSKGNKQMNVQIVKE